MSARRARALLVLSAVALVVAALAFMAARGEPFTYPWGVRLWRLVHLNMLGALLTLVGAAVGLWAAKTRNRTLALVAGGWFAVLCLWLLTTLGSEANLLGSRGDTLSMWLALSIGPLALALTPDEETG